MRHYKRLIHTLVRQKAVTVGQLNKNETSAGCGLTVPMQQILPRHGEGYW